MKRVFAALLSVVLLLACTGCTAPSNAQTLGKFSTYFFDTFDTVITLIGYTTSQEAFNEAADKVHESFLHCHKLFDQYNEYAGVTNVYTLNQIAKDGPVKVDDTLFDLLAYCKKMQPDMENTVNIAMGSVLQIWHEYRERGINDPDNAALPAIELLQAAAKHTNIDDMILDEENKTVYFADPELQLDLGAVAKGYAAELVGEMLYDIMPSYILSAGGNIRTGEAPADGRTNWSVGVQDPDGAAFSTNGSDRMDILYMTNMSAVTSGDYQRYYTVDGVNYHHLISPATLMPGTNMRAVTVVTENSAYADLLSTTLFLLPYEDARALAESLDGVEALFVLNDRTVEMTEGMKKIANSQGATGK